jgi:hypothetical protein
MAICDGVRENTTEAGVFHLKGVRQGIRADAFPLVPARLWLFVLLSSPRAGAFPGYICVVNDKTERIVFYAHLEPRPRFDSGDKVLPGRVRIRCAFPEAGRYTFQVWFFQEQGSDVSKGELPFTVVNEGA